jgi:hypothetical protein
MTCNISIRFGDSKNARRNIWDTPSSTKSTQTHYSALLFYSVNRDIDRISKNETIDHSTDNVCYSDLSSASGLNIHNTPTHSILIPTYLATKKKYKPVALKTKPVIREMFQIIQNIVGDPLQDIPILLTHPPPFLPMKRYTQE